jgi:hypothetical protein
MPFGDAKTAAEAIRDYERRILDRLVHVDPGTWPVYRMKTTVSFVPA